MPSKILFNVSYNYFYYKPLLILIIISLTFGVVPNFTRFFITVYHSSLDQIMDSKQILMIEDIKL